MERRPCRRQDLAPLAPQRHPLQGHQCRDAVVGRRHQGLCLPLLAHLQASARARWTCAQRRDRRACRLCQFHHGTETDDKGEEQEREIPFLKGYTVFNAEQCDDLPAHFTAKVEPPALPASQRIDAADRFFAATGAAIRHGGTRAFYAEGSDHIQMPPFETFRDAESYAATLAHECVHWTKHEKRLARDFGRVRWGDEGYAKEELVAELGSAFLCADLAITPEVRDDHASYIASWLKALKDDKRLIFTAAAHAQRAVDHLHGLQPKTDEAETTEEQAAA